jgi:putative endonuclease
VPVSSRGQDTWFSATGPGFESPYRYHPSLACIRERATDGRPSFAECVTRRAGRRHASSLTDKRRISTEARSGFSASEGGPPSLSHNQSVRDFMTTGVSKTMRPVSLARNISSDSARQGACSVRGMSQWFVYILRNAETPPRYYTGHTSDVARRQTEHNAGSCIHTAKYRPWSVDVVIEFSDEQRAVAFERYLKSGSGVAFAQRHLR